ncbi:MAG: hypothetical protein HY098_06120 [Nitrospinae bacterium]|nr:hypothetical protein [Nitrospinota bacterium]
MNANPRPLLVLLLAEDGIFEPSKIWSVLHRQRGEFDLVLLDRSGGATKTPKPMQEAAVKTVVVGPGGLGKAVNSLCAERQNGVLAFTSDRVCPTHEHWLKRLCEPLWTGKAEAAFGRQAPSPGGNHFFNHDLEVNYPADGDRADRSFFSMDNCAVTREALLKRPFPEVFTYDPAAVWLAANDVSPVYRPSAVVMRYTLLTLRGIYEESRGRGMDLSAAGSPSPSLARETVELLRGIWTDLVFAASIKKPQYAWYPPFRRFAMHFGHYQGAGKK